MQFISFNFLWYIVKNCTKNLLMFLMPNIINRIRKVTGTGSATIDHDITALVAYYKSVFDKYTRCLEATDPHLSYVKKTIVELGPGDTIAIALFFLAYGAARVFCYDRFKLITDINKNSAIARSILHILPEKQKQELQKIISFNKKGHVEWDTNRLTYLLHTEHLSQIAKSSVDIIVSNAVLEHVQDLENLFATMSYVMKPGGLMVHAADLGSHGLHFKTPLDFLTMPDKLWRLMTYYRGAPNRARKSHYIHLAVRYGLDILQFQTTKRFSQEEIATFKFLQPSLAAFFSEDDLSCESILFTAQKRVP
mgnify:CR=1 FL=1